MKKRLDNWEDLMRAQKAKDEQRKRDLAKRGRNEFKKKNRRCFHV